MLNDKSASIKSVMPKTPVGDNFGMNLTGALNPVNRKAIASDGENRAIDKKKSSVLKNVLNKITSK